MLKTPKTHTSQIMKHRDKYDMTDTSQYSVYKDKKGTLYLLPISELVTPASTPKPTWEAQNSLYRQVANHYLPDAPSFTTEKRIMRRMLIMEQPNNVQVMLL